MTAHIDLVPTLCSMAGFPIGIEEELDGSTVDCNWKTVLQVAVKRNRERQAFRDNIAVAVIHRDVEDGRRVAEVGRADVGAEPDRVAVPDPVGDRERQPSVGVSIPVG